MDNYELLTFENFLERYPEVQKNYAGKYLMSYLKHLEIKCVIVEKEYVDKDYLIDYSKFYSRSFSAPPRFAQRFHFFRESFSKQDFEKSLEGNTNIIKLLSEAYLGFIIRKPIKSLIGRTVIVPPVSLDENNDEVFYLRCEKPFSVSLFGIPLSVSSLPFQTQDGAVSACATVSLWTALHALKDRFDNVPVYSPAEITEISNEFPGLSRKFPSGGLGLYQMINFFRSIGIETYVIKLDEAKNLYKKEEINDYIKNLIKSYLRVGIPIVAVLKLTRKESCSLQGRHAVVISGYRCNDGDLIELYVHDDQIGPYSSVKPENGNLLNWQTGWIGYKVELIKLMIPLHHKIRFSFDRLYNLHRTWRKKIVTKYFDDERAKVKSDLFLTTVQKYKQDLLSKRVKDKVMILTKNLPRYMWVVRYSLNTSPRLDLIYDATDVFNEKPIEVIKYENMTKEIHQIT